MAAEAFAKGRVGDLVLARWRFGAGTSSHPYANLIETRCHGFDMLEHLVGPIESVMAQKLATAAWAAWWNEQRLL